MLLFLHLQKGLAQALQAVPDRTTSLLGKMYLTVLLQQQNL